MVALFCSHPDIKEMLHMTARIAIQLLLCLVLPAATWAADVRISQFPSPNVSDPAVARQSTGETIFVWIQDEIVGRRFDATGQSLDASPFLISNPMFGADFEPDVAMNDSGQIVVVWREVSITGTTEVFARLYTFDGSTGPSDIIPVNLFFTSEQMLPKVVMDASGAFAVVYQSGEFDGDLSGIVMRRFDATGQPLDNEQQVNVVTQGRQSHPAIAQGPTDELAVSWLGDSQTENNLLLRLFDDDGSPTSDPIEVAGAPFQLCNALAVSSQDVILSVWCSPRIMGRLFDAMGMPLTDAFFIDEPGLDVDAPVVIARESGGFHVVWEQNQPDSSDVDLYGRIVLDDGTFLDVPTQVTATREGIQRQPELAMQADELLVTYANSGTAGPGIFSTCFTVEGCTEIFLDGFEAGNTSRWGATLP